jgi:hypothetical protein
MINEELDSFKLEVKSFLRDFKLDKLENNYNIDISNQSNFFYRISKKRKILNKLYSLGGILTGSKALSLYRINGEKILNRSPNDIDIVISKENFYKFCGLYNIEIDRNYNRLQVSMSNSFTFLSSNYDDGSGYKVGYDIDIIGSDDLPGFIEVDNIRISSIESIIESKLYLIINRGDTKHIKDIDMIMSKVIAYK